MIMMERFESHVLIGACEKCLGQGNRVFTDHYLCIFSETTKLFATWGLKAAFKDAEKAIQTLEIRRVTGAGCYYRELQPLLRHEREVGETSGTKAFVAVHRRMAFAVSFLQALQRAVEDDSKFQAKHRLQTYKETLSAHQPSLTQSAVKLALLALPGRRGLLSKLEDCCHGDVSATQALRDITTRLHLLHTTADKILKEETAQKTNA